MIIDLSKVELGSKEINVDLSGIDASNEEDPVRFSPNAKLVGTMSFQPPRLGVGGKISTSAQVDCTRCSETVERDIDIEFSSVFVPEKDFPKEAELEVPSDDLDIDVIEGQYLDLREVVREQLLLWIPATALCKVDCKGICSGCGEDLNHTECKCPVEEVDPRWSELLKLKEQE